ncbi:histidine kinase [Streptomyces sp. NPDC000594]|uniref:sensor histidine kinase n=1 Tax=Streptomyces sp. NPDC000594 TaxID=3154261 RepID=UPI00331FAC94
MSARRAIRAARPVRDLFGRTARLRWLHLLLGGALLMPYWLLAAVLLTPVTADVTPLSGPLSDQLLAYGLALPIAAVTACAPLARPLSVAAARALCGVPARALADGPARSWDARLGAGAWFVLHTGIGALISGATLAVPPFAGTMLVVSVCPWLREPLEVPAFPAWVFVLLPFAGTALLLALAWAAAASGRLLARLAPRLLGPSPADRLAAAERRSAELAERNRIARELHDSVGHALSAVTLQAGAARRVLEKDPEFVREALTAIEETTRQTVGELDAVLGLLREDMNDTDTGDGDRNGDGDGDRNGMDKADRTARAGGADGTGPGLEALAGLVSRAAPRVFLTCEDDLSTVPAPVSRAAYRIIQEGITNALRHGADQPVDLTVRVLDDWRDERPGGWLGRLLGRPTGPEGPGVRALMIVMDNLEHPGPHRPRPGGGRGLRGIAERAELLGGRARSGPVPTAPGQSCWRLLVHLPLTDRPGTGGDAR